MFFFGFLLFICFAMFVNQISPIFLFLLLCLYLFLPGLSMVFFSFSVFFCSSRFSLFGFSLGSLIMFFFGFKKKIQGISTFIVYIINNSFCYTFTFSKYMNKFFIPVYLLMPPFFHTHFSYKGKKLSMFVIFQRYAKHFFSKYMFRSLFFANVLYIICLQVKHFYIQV